ncbi:MAG: hypothetical protein JWO12_2736 [Frankiales bacterium]|nr:hypothetical protein [Frankiales bacterium]
MRNDDATLDALMAAVDASSKARARWDALTADQVEPLVAWVCGARTRRGRRQRVSDLVEALQRPAYGPSGSSASAALVDTALSAPFWVESLLNR